MKTSFELLYVRWLWILALLACTMALKAIAFPRWPQAKSLDQKAIEDSFIKAGLNFELVGTIPQTNEFEVATSSGLHYKLEKENDLILFHGKVRQRFNFQVAFLGRTYPKTRLKRKTSHLLKNPPMAMGVVNGLSTIQTCLVQNTKESSSKAGVTRIQLGLLADEAFNHSAYSPQQIIGLTPNRSYDCTLVSLSSHFNGNGVNVEHFYRLIQSLESARIVK